MSDGNTVKRKAGKGRVELEPRWKSGPTSRAANLKIRAAVGAQ